MKKPSYLEARKRKFLQEGKRGLKLGVELPTPAAEAAPPPNASRHTDFALGHWLVRPGLATLTRASETVTLSATTLTVLLVLHEGFDGQRGELMAVDTCAARVYGHPRHADRVRLAVGELRRLLDGEDARIDSPLNGHYQLVVGDGPAQTRPEYDLPEAGAMRGFLNARRRRRLIFGAVAATITLGGGGALLGWMEDGGPVLRGRPSAPIALTNWPGREESPSLSPDGRRVVFSWTPSGGTSDLYVLAFGQTQPQRLLPASTAERKFPSWSPSAKRIAYYQIEGQDCELRSTSPLGEEDHPLTVCNASDAGPLTWTPDGLSLVFAEKPSPEEPVRIVAFDLDDKFGQGRRQALTNPSIGMPGDALPALSADGHSLYFARERTPGNMDIAGIDFGHTEIRRMTRDASTWSGLLVEPGGLSLVGSSDRGGAEALWRLPVTGDTPELLLEAATDLRHPAMSSDGQRLVFERAREMTRVLKIHAPSATNATTTTNANPANSPPVEWRGATAHVTGPQFSPDGRSVVFVSDQGGRAELWLATVDGQQAHPLTTLHATRIDTPRWSPDGRRLVISAAVDGYFQIYLVDAATGEHRRLTVDKADERVPAFSRDGRWIYYASTRGAVVIEVAGGPPLRGARWQIWRRPVPGASTAAPVQITLEGGFSAQETTDGTTLLYTRPDRPGLWSRPTQGGGDDLLVARQLAVPDFSQWAVTTEAIYFIARDSTADGQRGTALHQLVRLAWPSRETTTLRSLARPAKASGLTVSADGTALLYVQTARWETDLQYSTLH